MTVPSRIPGWLARPLAGKDAVRLLTNSMPTDHETFTDATGWEPTYPTYREGLRQIVETWEREQVVAGTPEGYEWTAA
ncbi:MAG: hypothetical protein ABEI96_01065 [Haloarculaceae archaeon]